MKILKLTTHKAKKAYVCDNDKKVINPGDLYARGFVKTDTDKTFEFFLCESCNHQINKKKYLSESWLTSVYERRKREKRKSKLIK
jgi:hypothetical protein